MAFFEILPLCFSNFSYVIPNLFPPQLSASDSDTSDLSDEDDEEMNLLKFFEEQKQHSHNADELVVTAAKEMGKELYANLDPAERKEKLDATVSRNNCLFENVLC